MKTNLAQIHLAVVDDHNLFRKGLIKLIKVADPDNRFSILFDVENGIELQNSMKREEIPDIVLMDINMPGMDGFETVQWLREKHPMVKVLVVSMLETEEAILRMLRLGVKGYLSKDIEVDDMHRALEAIVNGDIYYSGFVSEVMLNSHLNTRPEEGESAYKDTDIQFLQYICTDLTYEQIADKMCLSPKTIDGYRAGFFKRFNVKNRASLAVYVIKQGIISLEDV